MDEDLSSTDNELLALFLEEAGDRLERISDLVSGLEKEPGASTQLQRELHALKGASRMMGFREIADACHKAEDLLDRDSPESRIELELLGNLLRALIEGLAGSDGEVEEPRREAAETEPRIDRPPPRREELRIPSRVVDDLADRGARLRIMSVAAQGLVDRIFRLATLAERGVGEREPRQVLATLATSLRQAALEFETGQRIFRRLSDRQVDALLRLQVQPLKPFLRLLADHARELAASLGKNVKVRIKAGDARLDRRIVNALREAFLHLVRNSVDHGIEDPRRRAEAGKSEVGEIRIEADEEEGRVRIRVADDGTGIDIASVVDTAVQRRIVTPEMAGSIDTAEALQFLFRPGFTTRGETSDISGRGVGLDAVATSVRSVGGDLWLESSPGEGTEVVVEVPLARRGDRVLVVRVGRHQVAVPASPVRAYQRIRAEMITIENGHPTLRVGGDIVDARFLSAFLGEHPGGASVMVEMIVGGSAIALVVDSIIGEEEVIIRPLLPAAGAPDSFEGMALLSGGRPVPVISIPSLGPHQKAHVSDASLLASPSSPIHVLLVDDSRVTREMLRRLLEDAGFSVTSVGSADEAMLVLDREHIDCLLTDIEMPGVDGLDLTRRLRRESEHTDLPIVVVSTLDRPADRLAGLESGANAYLTKQGLDVQELVALIHRVGGRG